MKALNAFFVFFQKNRWHVLSCLYLFLASEPGFCELWRKRKAERPGLPKRLRFSITSSINMDWILRLQSADVEVRAKALREWRSFSEKYSGQLIAYIEPKLKDPELAVRKSAAEALSDLGKENILTAPQVFNALSKFQAQDPLDFLLEKIYLLESVFNTVKDLKLHYYVKKDTHAFLLQFYAGALAAAERMFQNSLSFPARGREREALMRRAAQFLITVLEGAGQSFYMIKHFHESEDPDFFIGRGKESDSFPMKAAEQSALFLKILHGVGQGFLLKSGPIRALSKNALEQASAHPELPDFLIFSFLLEIFPLGISSAFYEVRKQSVDLILHAAAERPALKGGFLALLEARLRKEKIHKTKTNLEKAIQILKGGIDASLFAKPAAPNSRREKNRHLKSHAEGGSLPPFAVGRNQSSKAPPANLNSSVCRESF